MLEQAIVYPRTRVYIFLNLFVFCYTDCTYISISKE